MLENQIDLTKFKCAYKKIVPIFELVPNPRNPNDHPEVQIDFLAKVIAYQGQRSPIVVSNRSGFITKGHGRLMALQKLKWTHAAVDFQDYESEAQEFADVIADNKIAELAEMDDNKINEIAFEFMDEIIDFDVLGIPDFKVEPLEVEMPSLATSDPGIQTVTFVLSNEQKDILDEAIAKSKKNEHCEDELNKNSNGNALAAILKRYLYG